MKAENVIDQLVGPYKGADFSDDLALVLYECERYGKDVNVDFNSGVVEVLSEDGTGVEQRFAIKATLEPLEE